MAEPDLQSRLLWGRVVTLAADGAVWCFQYNHRQYSFLVMLRGAVGVCGASTRTPPEIAYHGENTRGCFHREVKYRSKSPDQPSDLTAFECTSDLSKTNAAPFGTTDRKYIISAVYAKEGNGKILCGCVGGGVGAGSCGEVA